MKLKNLYQEAVKKGIDSDIRSKVEINDLLKDAKKGYDKLSKKEQERFDPDALFNPFNDTRILAGNPEADIKSVIVGIDVEGPELLLIDRLNQKGKKIDLALAHHPEGYAYAGLAEVMDLQVDMFIQQGLAVGVSENSLMGRKMQIARGVSAVNHARSVDIANHLGINFMCVHTPTDNLAYQYMRKLLDKVPPKKLGQVIDSLFTLPEYIDAAKKNNPPRIFSGSKSSRCKNIFIEFTGGTGLCGDQAGTDDVIGVFAHFLDRVGQLHTATLAATAGVNLGFDYPTLTADFLGNDTRRGFRICDTAFRYWYAIGSEKFFGLVFVDVHSGFILLRL